MTIETYLKIIGIILASILGAFFGIIPGIAFAGGCFLGILIESATRDEI